jgi:hypothetical protein
MMRFRFSVLVMLVFSGFVAAGADSINVALPCGKIGTVGGLGSGTDLTRYTIDTTRFPNALCNDGTPGVFYYAPATRAADEGKWLIFLQGGGACTSGQGCAQRWCSIDSNYGMDKMSSAFSKPQIRGAGFMSPDAENRFGTWNRVLIFYCSSDQWGGSKANTLSATAPGGGSAVQFGIQFRGSQIVESVIDTLRNATPGSSSRRRAVGHGSTGGGGAATSAWPDLDLASHVIFAGSSGGGNGVKNNADRVGQKLRSTNPSLLDYRVLIDAATGPITETYDYSKTTYCAENPSGCTYEDLTRGLYQFVDVDLYANRGDQSCIDYHKAKEAGSEWRCNDKEHVMFHHITSPVFYHQDIQDPQVGGAFVDFGLGTPDDYARGTDAILRNLPVSEEPRGGTPGVFTVQCMTHESFTNNQDVFDIKVNGFSYNQVVWNWWSGTQPQQVFTTYTGTPGKAPGCPPD